MTNKIKYIHVEYKIDVPNSLHNYGFSSLTVNKYEKRPYPFCTKYKEFQVNIYESLEEIIEHVPVRKPSVAITESVSVQGRAIYQAVKSRSNSVNSIYNITKNLIIAYSDGKNGKTQFLSHATIPGGFILVTGESNIQFSIFKQGIVKLLIGLQRDIVMVILTCNHDDVAKAILDGARVMRKSNVHVIGPAKPKVRVNEVIYELKKVFNCCW